MIRRKRKEKTHHNINFSQDSKLNDPLKVPKKSNVEELTVTDYSFIDDDELLNEKDRMFGLRKIKKKKKNKTNSLKIVPIKNDAESYIEPPHPNLLRLPFFLLIVAPKGSGKSTINLNLLKWYRGYFDNNYIFSPTIKKDSSWIAAFRQDLIDKIEDSNITNRYNETKMKNIYKNIEDNNEGHEDQSDKIQTMFVMDDIVGELPRNRTNTMYKLARNHRHSGISAIVISQEFNALPNVLRKNTTGLILLKTDNYKELESIIEECSALIGKWRFLRMYVECISKPYGFMFINKDLKERFRYFFNFEKELNPFDYSNDRIRDIIQVFREVGADKLSNKTKDLVENIKEGGEATTKKDNKKEEKKEALKEYLNNCNEALLDLFDKL